MLFPLLLWGAAALLFILALLVSTPWKLHVSWRSAPKNHFAVRAQAFGGLVPSFELARDLHSSTKAKPAKSRSRLGARRKSLHTVQSLSAIQDLVKGLMRRLDVEDISVDAEFGSGDPAETGQLYGLLAPLTFSTHQVQNIHLVARPNFNERCLNGGACMRVRLVPITLVIPIALFAWCLYGPAR